MLRGITVLEEEVEARKQVASRLAAGDPALQRRAGEQIPLLQLRNTEQQGRREVGWLHSVSAPQAAPLPGRTKQPDELNHLRVTSCSSSSCWEVFLPLAIGEPRGKRQAPSQNLHECQQRQTASKLALSLASHTQRADSRRLPGKQRSRRLEIRRESWRVTWTRTRLDQACEPSMLPVCRAGETGQRRKHHS